MDIDNFEESEITETEVTEVIEQEAISSTGTDSTAQFPITREDFYLIPILLCILILMLFLKWTFPMKGGKKL